MQDPEGECNAKLCLSLLNMPLILIIQLEILLPHAIFQILNDRSMSSHEAYVTDAGRDTSTYMRDGAGERK